MSNPTGKNANPHQDLNLGPLFMMTNNNNDNNNNQ